MKYKTDITKLLYAFNEIKAEHLKKSRCKEKYCSTCGGWGIAVRRGLSFKMISEIKELLKKITLEELEIFGEWVEMLELLNIVGVVSAYVREGKMINFFGIKGCTAENLRFIYGPPRIASKIRW